MVYVVYDECAQHDLEDVGGQVVVKEESAVGEEEGHVVEDVAGKEHLPGVQKLVEHGCE